MANLITDDMHARLSRMLRAWETKQGSGVGSPRQTPEINTPMVICRLLLEITTDPDRLGRYTAEEVRWEDDGLGAPTSVGWKTVTDGITFDTDNPLQEITEKDGIATEDTAAGEGAIVMAEQRATFFPNEVSSYKRPTLWIFQIGGGGDGGFWGKIDSVQSGSAAVRGVVLEDDGQTPVVPEVRFQQAYEVNNVRTPKIGLVAYFRPTASGEPTHSWVFDAGMGNRQLFPVRLAIKSGLGGDASSAPSYLYDLRTLNNVAIVGAPVDQAPFTGRNVRGKVGGAQYGTAYYNETGEAILWSADEQDTLKDCPV